MPLKMLQSAKFDVSALGRAFEDFSRSIPPDAFTRPNDTRPAGAHVFTGFSNVRLVLQYEIQTDTFSGRFDALIETPDAD